ncbi:uncharacterized protein LY89DRAFT_86925 [Mollisia scopiformis]|uniref:Uncharacterized protein n=1 Tax=Mollisia scopiformis TaxID=149040 RepID=A0A194X8V6_MOLSC|nr:uncharacterized protein LY89DRAFT_86925 [Mollisia scopiformis]KUJ16549.1 hypothetical protein LY89DRAFT_86925 [Mollisia scopiformis]
MEVKGIVLALRLSGPLNSVACHSISLAKHSCFPFVANSLAWHMTGNPGRRAYARLCITGCSCHKSTVVPSSFHRFTSRTYRGITALGD